jgi:2-haloacid dehalogenase
MLASAVQSADMGRLLDAVLSVDAIRMYKPRREVYALATKHFKVSPGEIVFVSSNRWDIMGAAACGFCTAWVNRTNAPQEYEPAADAVVSDLKSLTTIDFAR